MMILNKDRWPARRWYIPGVKSDAINKDDLSICWQESLPPPLDIMRALQIFLFSSFGSHFFHYMFKVAFQANRRGSCQWHNKLSVTPTCVWTESKRSPPQHLRHNHQSNTSQSVTTVVWFETEKEGGATGSFRNRSKDILQCWAFIIITILSLFVIWGQNTLSPHSRELSLEKWVTVLVPSHVTSCVQCYCNTRASFP